MILSVNGLLMDGTTGGIHPRSAGFQYGYGVFETMKINRGQAVFLQEHVNRMMASLVDLNMKPDRDLHWIETRCNQLIRANHLEHGYLKIVCARSEQDSLDWIMLTGNKNYREVYARGFSLCFASVRRNESSVLCRIKSLNYLENQLQRERAGRMGFDEAIFLNSRDQVCEGTVSNLFWFHDGQICTPDIDCGLLPGIVRQKVLDLCEETDIPVTIGHFSKEQLLQAEAVFLTNSLMDILPVRQLDDRVFEPTAIGPSLDLLNRYRERYDGDE